MCVDFKVTFRCAEFVLPSCIIWAETLETLACQDLILDFLECSTLFFFLFFFAFWE